MKHLYKLRAKLICREYKGGNCSIVVSDVLRRYLKEYPSITERGTCKKKGCSSKNFELQVPTVGLNSSEFDGKMMNLEKAITANFPSSNLCRKCRQPYNSFERTFNNHLFIEVFLHT